MAQRVHVVLEDDIDGTPATETIKFEFGGTAYEIDLNERNAQRFRDDMAEWIGHARKAGRTASASPRRRNNSSANDIREWARSQGMQVSSRGRVSAEVREAYARAH